MLPAQILNDLFIEKTDNDMNAARNMVRAYVRDRVYDRFIHRNRKPKDDEEEFDFSAVPDGLEIDFHKIAGRVTLSLSGFHRGKKVKGSESWTEMQLLADGRPVTRIFDDLIFKVFTTDASVVP